jgi:hypothetical protein
MHWDEKDGWMLDVPFALSPVQVKACVDYTLKMQADRILCMMPGDRKEQASRALQVLRAGGTGVVRQRIIASTDESVLYEAPR